MKKILLLLITIASFNSYSQKIKVDETDKFTGQRRIETSSVNLKVAAMGSVLSSIRGVDTSFFINLSGAGPAAVVIGSNDQAIFLLDDESTVIIYSTDVQGYKVVGPTGKTYDHQYKATFEVIKKLSEHSIKSVRKYGSRGYQDFDVPERNQNNLKELAALFLSTFNTK